MPALEDSLRQAQARANEQRTSVAQVQQQIQVLAAEQRNIEEQSRQLNQRRERLSADRNALAAPDEARLLNAQTAAGAARRKRPRWPTPCCTSCRTACPSSTKHAAARSRR